MKKILLTASFGLIFLGTNYVSAIYSVSNQDYGNKYCGWVDEHRSETTYNVYEQAPQRNGFRNEEQSTTYKSQTYGDTTYHTAYPSSPRKGYSR